MKRHELDVDNLANMPLHTITEEFGTEGLLERFDIEMSTLDEETKEQLNKALLLVRELHLEDARSTEPYINHLLRVCMRTKIYYEITDPDILVATLLHDSVEDHATDIIGDDLGSDKENQRAALEVISELFNPRVAKIISGVTNPEFSEERDIMEAQYLEHLEDLLENGDPGSVVVKLSDFTDNATGINYSSGPKVKKWANKYLPIVPIMRHALLRKDLPLSEEVKEHIRKQLNLTAERLKDILDQY
jgi:(p)ppGpp synthase/HD superfamily hydrolase